MHNHTALHLNRTVTQAHPHLQRKNHHPHRSRRHKKYFAWGEVEWMAMTGIKGSMRQQATKHQAASIRSQHVTRREHKQRGISRRCRCMVGGTLLEAWADRIHCPTTEATDIMTNRPTTRHPSQRALYRAREYNILRTLPRTLPGSSSSNSSNNRRHRLNHNSRQTNSNSLNMGPEWCITFLSLELHNRPTTLCNLTINDSQPQLMFCPTNLESSHTSGRMSRQVALCLQRIHRTLLHKSTLPLTRNRRRLLAPRYRKRIRWE